MKKTLKLLFIIGFFVVCILPVGLMWADTSTLSENRSLSNFPEWTLENGEWNEEFFNEFETWLAEHFAFRGALVEADGALKYHVFASPSDEQVIIGKDDWLFFDATLNDYAGVTLSEAEIDAIADTLQKTCEYIESQGKQPMIMIAPNKNTIYPELMPDRFGDKSEVSNRTLLHEALQERGVPYLDAAKVLIDYKATDEVYLHHDTHWNNTGARLVMNALYKAWGLEDEYELTGYSVENTHESDLYQILFPQSEELEAQRIYEAGNEFDYKGRVRSMDDLKIQTNCENGNGKSVLVYRDSFGRAMIPYMGETFSQCVFNRSTPYDLSLVEETECDYVLIEIVERNIADLGDIEVP